jgi:hypothetical protein
MISTSKGEIMLHCVQISLSSTIAWGIGLAMMGYAAGIGVMFFIHRRERKNLINTLVTIRTDRCKFEHDLYHEKKEVDRLRIALRDAVNQVKSWSVKFHDANEATRIADEARQSILAERNHYKQVCESQYKQIDFFKEDVECLKKQLKPFQRKYGVGGRFVSKKKKK